MHASAVQLHTICSQLIYAISSSFYHWKHDYTNVFQCTFKDGPTKKSTTFHHHFIFHGILFIEFCTIPFRKMMVCMFFRQHNSFKDLHKLQISGKTTHILKRQTCEFYATIQLIPFCTKHDKNNTLLTMLSITADCLLLSFRNEQVEQEFL